ncbi:MAG: tripartite tricarboxylate transporter permease [Nanoarchaeota archaeon]|nr:tripartite tricarboxylate transporter permease [Nanoarchaeota archaeon]MBU1945700.1 tripartite tricarboxylate transporter permease [Nanoarchaeota archaeon]
MVFVDLMIAILCGVAAGIITGLTPGIHVNLVSALLVGFSGYLLGITSGLTLAVFIVAMGITHTFLDSIPSIFLGAPDSDMVLAVLPGHRLLLEGKGYEAVKLTVIGSLISLLATIWMIPFMLPVVPKLYLFIQPFVGYLLVFVVVFMIWKEKKMNKVFWAVFVFFVSGILGILVLGMPNLEQPLFPLLSGLFGVSALITSLIQDTKIPKQSITETIKVKFGAKVKAIIAAVFSGSLTGLLPGVGAAQAAVIATELVGEIGVYAFMIMIGGINTVNFTFSLVTFFTLSKARNGAVVAIMEIVKGISFEQLIVLIFAALIAGGIAAYLALFFAKVFSKFIVKVNYKLVSICVIGFIFMISVYFSGLLGVLILVTSTAVGIIPALTGVKRSNAMGCLLLPVIIYFLF